MLWLLLFSLQLYNQKHVILRSNVWKQFGLLDGKTVDKSEADFGKWNLALG